MTAEPAGDVATDGLLPSDVVGARRGWFPVVAETALEHTTTPVAFTLLGDSYVAWTGPDGEPAVTARRCPHRRADLAGGSVTAGALTCAYHGWRFDPCGTCTSIPQLAPGSPVPRGAGIRALTAVRRWGMVWVWGSVDDDPAAFPVWDDVAPPPSGDGFDVFLDRIETWNASALRVVDNLLDTLHPAFVHVGTFGDPARADVEAESVDPIPDGVRTIIAERSAAEQTTSTDLRVTLTELVGPFSVRTRAYTGPGGTAGRDDFALWTVAVPLDDATTNYVRFQATDPRLRRDRDALRAFTVRVLAEDRPVVEGLEQPLPLRPGTEIHLRADRPTIAYRRYLSARQRATPWPPVEREVWS